MLWHDKAADQGLHDKSRIAANQAEMWAEPKQVRGSP